MSRLRRLLECLRHEPSVDTVPDPAIGAALDDFWPMFIRSRSLCGYLPEDLVGAEILVPGEFYRESTPYQAIVLREPLTASVRDAHNRIGAWTNENCLIRLWAVLESNGFTKPIRDGANKAETVKLLKRLRQHFAHGSGSYDAAKPRHRALRRDLLKLYPVPGDPPGLPTDIDRVLKPIYEDCRLYVRSVLTESSGQSARLPNKRIEQNAGR